VSLGERGAQLTLSDCVGAIDALTVRRDTIEAMIGELIPSSPWAETVARLRCLRGIDTLSAVGLAAEIGDFERFEHPRQLMSYLGLVPSEKSSCETRRQGQITKSGSRHARRLLVEAACTTAARPGSAPLSSAAKRAATDGHRDRVESPAAPTPGLAPPGHQARQPRNARLRRRRNPPGHHARELPRLTYEQPPRRPRSPLDSGLSPRNRVLRYPTRAYQTDHTSRTRQARRPLSRARPLPHRRKPHRP
jgi:Transposase IS116/IS110/IS902 family